MASPISVLQPSFFHGQNTADPSTLLVSGQAVLQKLTRKDVFVKQAFVQKATIPHVVKFSPLFQSGGSLPCSQKPESPMPFMMFHNILILLTMNICFFSVRPTSCRFPHVQLSATVFAIYPQFHSISGDLASFDNARTHYYLLTRDTENVSFTNRELYFV
jgi:hypothetical protein